MKSNSFNQSSGFAFDLSRGRRQIIYLLKLTLMSIKMKLGAIVALSMAVAAEVLNKYSFLFIYYISPVAFSRLLSHMSRPRVIS